ncbi:MULTISPECIES: 3-dehydro-L-gulonate 2-dehydrogenase [Flavobacteriaceae]|uniref:3-dehydro-L-gulonate 2-dehydrogenase n=1 Tax=Flavobacteriaceae TaxID=49546 RepID=UPI001C0F1EB4|nr:MULTISPECIES: 3-dehydro-L-gulonate 2-dehydrogenase [Allomuricauda]MDC6365928.1 3-dehydro-L-gulonate 2-dehydrogenase [Muricauda sp. AC10]
MKKSTNIIKISHDTLFETLLQLFAKYGCSDEKSKLLAETYTESTLVGVNSHGVNRVPAFIEYIEKGLVKIEKEAQIISSFGTIERWDGNFGPGIINATKCTERAITLAKKHGIGIVALKNTNHWMRGGTYAHQAANQGCISILFTNTIPNMPPWGGKDSRIGNNPFVVSIPRKEGHVVLDMAISQFAFGKINDYRLRGEQLPYYGGWDQNDELSKDPEKILVKQRGLPIGYWKGSALAMVLDMLATVLSAGDSSYKISQRESETGISQIYLCMYPEIFGDSQYQEKLLNEIIDYTHDVEPIKPGERTYYPGERSAATRVKNLKEGIPVSVSVWEKILHLKS